MQNIGYLIMKVSKDLRYLLGLKLEEYNITPAQWAVLNNLSSKENARSPHSQLTSAYIAAELGFDKPTISGIVKRLLEKGLITKDVHPTDRRASLLYLTVSAKDLIPRLHETSDMVINDSLKNFSNEEKIKFLSLLYKMEHTLND